MKIKILVAPALIAFAIWMAIWVLSPAYDQLRVDMQSLEDARGNLADINKKNEKVEKLSQSLSQSAETQDILLRYMPSSRKEEEIVDNINYLASREGLSVYQISVKKDESTQNVAASVSGANVPSVSGTADASAPSPAATSNAPEVSNQSNPKDIIVSVGIIGTYDKIRSFYNKLAALRRFNSVDSVKIEGEKTESGKEESASGILRAESSVRFNYLDKVASIINVNDKIFYRDTFDTSVIDDIKNKMNTSLVDLELPSSGRENPFIPN